MSDKYFSQRHAIKMCKSNYKAVYIGITDFIISTGRKGKDEAEGEEGGNERRRRKIR